MANVYREAVYAVVFEPATKLYCAGETISGHILTNFLTTFSFEQLIITCTGVDTLNRRCQHERIALNPLHEKKTLNLVQQILPDVKHKYKGKIHKFHFTFDLPTDIPSTWVAAPESEHHIGHIRYFIHASMKGFNLEPGLKCSTLDVTSQFCVQEKHPKEYDTKRIKQRTSMSDYPGVELHEDKIMLWAPPPCSKIFCLGKQKKVEVIGNLKKNVFHENDEITIQLETNNETKRNYYLFYSLARINSFIDGDTDHFIEEIKPITKGFPSFVIIKGGECHIKYIVLKTSLVNFKFQPSLTRSTQTVIKDYVHLVLSDRVSDYYGEVGESYIPIYVHSNGVLENMDHNGKQSSLAILTSPPGMTVPTYLTEVISEWIITHKCLID